LEERIVSARAEFDVQGASATAPAGLSIEAAASAWQRRWGVVRDLICLAKPRITVMVIVTGLGGMWLARRTGAVAALDVRVAIWALVGLALVVGGANALNMYIERESDGLMERTRGRPLPAGRMLPNVALAFGMLMSLLALPLLWWQVNGLTASLAGLSLLTYVLAYTPLKRITSRALVIGAVPGAMPPLLGWTAVTGELAAPGLALFAVLFFWQLPHFIAIATFRRAEYVRAGIKVLPEERGDRVARVHAMVYTVGLVVASLALVPLGVGGTAYLVNAILLGAVFAAVAGWGLSEETLRPVEAIKWARSLFAVSLFYLPLLIAAMMIGS
jgi:protoheme IX farnesyltransferase